MSFVKISIMATVPVDCAQQFLQHLRDFDMAHPGVTMIITGAAPDNLGVEEIERMLDVDPPFGWRKTVKKQ